MKGRRNWTNCSAQWCFSLLRWGDMLPYCAEWKNSRLTLAAGLLFQTTLSTLFQSGYHTHLCWFWTAQTLEKEKHNSLLSQSFAACLCRFLLHITHMPLHANEKMSRADHLATPRLVRGKSSCLHQRATVCWALCPTRISRSLDRHALGWLQRLLLRSLMFHSR